MSKVLIVEDQPSMAAMVRHHVENAGFDVVTATEVEGAWDVLMSETPDAAIVDIELPGKDGWDLLLRSRVEERTRHLPMVVLTGLHGRDVRDRAEAFGAEYFTKPFAASALVSKLHHMVGNGSGTIPSPAEMPDTIEELTAAVLASTSAMDEAEDILESLAAEQLAPPQPPADATQITATTAPSPAEGSPTELTVVKVVLMLPQYQIEGSIHMPAEAGRFSDAWEWMFESGRSFVPVTDAKVIFQGPQRSVAQTPFIQIRKTDITGIFPTTS